MKKQEEARFDRMVADVNRDHKLDQMKAFIQHGKVSTYDHALSVAKMSYRMNRFFKTGAKEKELVRGALLHDYFLYDWHKRKDVKKGKLHGFFHPGFALENAKRDFDLTKREENIIYSHMWPLTLWRLPRSREAVIVCIADKICSTKETLMQRKEKRTEAKERAFAETGKTD